MQTGAAIVLDPATRAMLLIAVHAEEKFDWSKFDRNAIGVAHGRALPRFQAVLESMGAEPTYFVDYPFATQAESREPVAAAGRAHLGTHLHPWVSPPHDEAMEVRNSYPGNLPAALEAAKLCRLTAAIEQGFGRRPRAYIAGRYGIGPNTVAILRDQDYDLDLSLSPTFDYSADGGPDFSDLDNTPRRAATTSDILHLPHTSGYIGTLCQGGAAAIRDRAEPAAARLPHQRSVGKPRRDPPSAALTRGLFAGADARVDHSAARGGPGHVRILAAFAVDHGRGNPLRA
ncbi:MAG: hypothetical protein EXQ96_04340 [Alphaproteobacteria bacterium]|nr:hypothetical protein [Alphaproteobacteria bacterium]